MEQGKLAGKLIPIGIVLLVVALGWWGLFYGEVLRATGGRWPDAFPCLYSSSGVCALISGGAQFIGKTPYNPLVFWAGAASLILGILMSVTASSTTAGELEVKQTSEPASAVRKCPYCAEIVKSEAVVCRFCQRDLPVDEAILARAEAAKAREEQARLNREAEAAKPKGKCPNCSTVVPFDSLECPKCKASFGVGSAWKVTTL